MYRVTTRWRSGQQTINNVNQKEKAEALAATNRKCNKYQPNVIHGICEESTVNGPYDKNGKYISAREDPAYVAERKFRMSKGRRFR